MGCKATTRILTLEETIGASAEEFKLEGMLVIGEGNPNAEEIVHCRVTPRLTQVSIAKELEGVEIRGVVDVCCVYVGRSDDAQKALFASVNWDQALTFHRIIEIPGVEITMEPEAKVCVTAVNHDLQADGRTLDIRLDIRVQVKASTVGQVAIIEDVTITEPEKAKVEKEQVRIDEVIESLRAELETRGTLTLAEDQMSVGRVLSYSAVPKINSTTLDEDCIVVDGDVEYKVLYVVEEPASEQDDPPETSVEEDLNSEWSEWQQETRLPAVKEQVALINFIGVSPFACRIKTSRTKEGMLFNPKLTVREVVVEGQGRELDVTCKMEVSGKTFHRHRVTLVKDVVCSQGRDVAVRSEYLQMTEIGSEGLARRKAEISVDIPEGKPAVDQVLDMTARIWTEEYQVLEDKVVVEASVFVEAVYTPHDAGYAPVQTATWNLENQFTIAIEIPINDTTMQPDLALSVESLSWELVTRSQIEVSLIVQANCTLQSQSEREVAVELVLVEPEEERPPSYRFVIVQQGDTLWKLAAKYRTTVKEILDENSWLLEQDDLEQPEAGWKLLIPSKKVSELRPIS